ncbi:nuclear pore complex assembly-domain-containing protein [Lipomyces arxii]|uniref:nuclear pore complex assembly-domain-containing protein n=1 Tax=Lipomyces arxii TaxID=56418 RepID=UPI0034D01F27
MDKMDETEDLAFDLIYPDEEFPYNDEYNNTINNQRTKLDGKLFFDLLSSDIADVQNVVTMYPPSNKQGLIELHEEIAFSGADTLKKQCLIYYILKDFTSTTASEEYAESCPLPPAYKYLLDGIHALDRFDFKTAMTNLTKPAVMLPFTEKLLSSLLQHSEAGPQYVRLYVAIKSPELESKSLMLLYLNGLCRLSLSSAFTYVRTTAEEDREEFMSAMIEYSLRSGAKDAAYHIANLPLTLDEEVMMLRCLNDRPDIASKNILVLRELYRGHVDNARQVAATMHKSVTLGTGSSVQWAEKARRLKIGANEVL